MDTVGLFCAHPLCDEPLHVPATGRTPKFCSEAHRKHAHQLRRRAERLEEKHLEAERRAEAERREIDRMCVEFVTYVMRQPAVAATSIGAWLERAPSRLQTRTDALFGLVRFVVNRAAAAAGDETMPPSRLL